MPLQTGDSAPGFDLPNSNPAIGGDNVSFSDAAGANGTLVVFECNHCPYVVASVDRINAMADASRNTRGDHYIPQVQAPGPHPSDTF